MYRDIQNFFGILNSMVVVLILDLWALVKCIFIASVLFCFIISKWKSYEDQHYRVQNKRTWPLELMFKGALMY